MSKSIKYKNDFKSFKKIQLILTIYSKNDLLICNYLYYNKNMDIYDNLAKNLKSRKIDFFKSRSLIGYIEKINKYKHDFKN